jgi:site-specific recombinase XerD
MCARGFLFKTRKTYLAVFKGFDKFLDEKEIKDSEDSDVRDYLAYLNRKGHSNISLNLVISAIKFAFGVFGKELVIKRPKKEKHLPSVLSKEEVRRILGVEMNPKHRLILRTIYGLGLRISELRNLKPEHIEFDRGMVLVKNSKGAKDRYVKLPDSLSKELRNFIELNGGEYVFFGRSKKINLKTIQKIFENALKKSRIGKKASCHTLRHSYATHLLEDGTDIRIIQKLLGHSKLETTQIYTHVSNFQLQNIKTPLDNL